MNNLFTFEHHEIRTQVNSDGTVLFVATDVAQALGHTNPEKMIRDLVDEDDRTTGSVIDNLGRNQVVQLVNEFALYDMLMGSRLDSAKRFKRWVTHEVLPAIRRDGYYLSKNPLAINVEKLEAELAEAKQHVRDQIRRAEQAERKLEHTRGKLKDEEAVVQQVTSQYLSLEASTVAIVFDPDHTPEVVIPDRIYVIVAELGSERDRNAVLKLAVDYYRCKEANKDLVKRYNWMANRLKQRTVE